MILNDFECNTCALTGFEERDEEEVDNGGSKLHRFLSLRHAICAYEAMDLVPSEVWDKEHLEKLEGDLPKDRDGVIASFSTGGNLRPGFSMEVKVGKKKKDAKMEELGVTELVYGKGKADGSKSQIWGNVLNPQVGVELWLNCE